MSNSNFNTVMMRTVKPPNFGTSCSCPLWRGLFFSFSVQSVYTMGFIDCLGLSSYGISYTGGFTVHHL